ncbi:uncharacterized protein LOC123418976 [Hordeum vulgare subsp. vulgare]|uniref:uncharacterized protein LOC123418976 n=1 Tax=Hordeum vulgare subsp. vulgare TaxID=112509 RepID=UPI001D1A4A48|nr:uncharacterized protein LOC123418976 [Hordeum vulgare subsp. vulgare]
MALVSSNARSIVVFLLLAMTMSSSTWSRCHALGSLGSWNCTTSETQPCSMYKCLVECKHKIPGLSPRYHCNRSVNPEQCCCKRAWTE